LVATISLPLWRQVYDQAAAVKQLAPWQDLYEDQIFCFVDPTSGEQVAVSVMGAGGEHLAIALYIGLEATHRFLAVTHLAVPGDCEVLELEQLHLSFEDRQGVSAEERDLIKQLSLKFRGSNAWPVVRRFHPAQLPERPTDSDLAMLLVALELLPLAYAQWLDDDRQPSLEQAAAQGEYLVYTSARQGDRLTWQGVLAPLPDVPLSFIASIVPPEVLARAKSLPRKAARLECDLVLIPRPLQDQPGESPYFPYLCLIVDPASDQVVHFDMVPPKPDWQEPYRQFAAGLLHGLTNANFLPKEIHVRTQRLALALTPLQESLGIKVKTKAELPAAAAVVAMIIQQFGQV